MGVIALASKRLRRREPSGRLQREREISPTEIRRLRDAAVRGLRDPEWGTELGRLLLNGELTILQYAAGKMWREHAARYRQAIGAFPVRSISLEQGVRAHPPDPYSEAGRTIAAREREEAEAFFAAHAALVAIGMGAESSVRRLVEQDEAMAGLYDLKNARAGLSALAIYYGLTNDGKSPNVR